MQRYKSPPFCSKCQEEINDSLFDRGPEIQVLVLAVLLTHADLNFFGPQFSPLEAGQAKLTKDTRFWSAS